MGITDELILTVLEACNLSCLGSAVSLYLFNFVLECGEVSSILLDFVSLNGSILTSLVAVHALLAEDMFRFGEFVKEASPSSSFFIYMSSEVAEAVLAIVDFTTLFINDEGTVSSTAALIV